MVAVLQRLKGWIQRLRGRNSAIDVVAVKESVDETSSELITIASIWIVILVVGVPWWWATTRVYRASLPFDDIFDLAEEGRLDVSFAIDVTLHTVPGLARDDFALHVSDATKQLMDQNLVSDIPLVYTNGSVPPPHTKLAVSVHFDSADHIGALDEAAADPLDITNSSLVGKYHLYVLNSAENSVGHGDVTIGSGRDIVVYLEDPSDESQVLRYASWILSSIFSEERRSLRRVVSEEDRSTQEHDMIKMLPYAPNYNVIISLINADPNTSLISWDIGSLLEAHVRPLLSSLSSISTFSVQSQVQYHSGATVTPTRQRDSADTSFVLRPSDLRNFINSAEWLLSSAVSADPPINFLLYVPPESQRPLRICDSDDRVVPRNAFLIPRWGGVVVLNPKLDAFGTERTDADDLKTHFETLAEHLRQLLGIQRIELNQAMRPASLTMRATSLGNTDTGITGFEFDRLLRKRIVQNLVNAARTLHSLGTLVQSMPNMVVQDSISVQIKDALRSIKQTQDLLSQTTLPVTLSASRSASLALTSAESAFFDPTMVSKLYFPDEHRLAIYTPFFVPAAVSLFAGSFKILKRYRSRNLSKIKME
ncbi:hypothetical protein M427DRAFT_115489 [Gonapodya prolifera JEL478]|uniref:GPI transamidase component PIG-S n=1 Tax=Gonapodya prolifera (strain JEL478) TaxID=1344416 RepID=A0A139A2H8_GONPJ|nr:hypothetical protein M427DRAFT_115489 [Gonapodya prolifera JEL478]|eukprot:KXS10899.1 hypothetical protein M427DRAFT_115489 [Gonapodya prolifera JEL478]